MDIEYTKNQVAKIAEMCARFDDPVAHQEEDNLHIEFIEHVAATGTPELVEMATEILKVSEMKFFRWVE